MSGRSGQGLLGDDLVRELLEGTSGDWSRLFEGFDRLLWLSGLPWVNFVVRLVGYCLVLDCRAPGRLGGFRPVSIRRRAFDGRPGGLGIHDGAGVGRQIGVRL